jgi:hypothetical protein
MPGGGGGSIEISVVAVCVGRAILLDKTCDDVVVEEIGRAGEVVELDRIEVATVVGRFVT